MKKRGHYCRICDRHRANEKFSGKGHAKHICKDCDREHRAEKRARKRELDSRVVFVQAVARPEQRLIVKYVVESDWDFANGKAADPEVWENMKTFSSGLGEPLGLWMPPALQVSAVSTYAQGVEVSVDYDGHVPMGFVIVDLPACSMMLFQGSPYTKGRAGEAIKIVQAAIRKFNPQLYGYQWADDGAPRMHWEPREERGYIEARPVRPGENPGIICRS